MNPLEIAAVLAGFLLRLALPLGLTLIAVGLLKRLDDRWRAASMCGGAERQVTISANTPCWEANDCPPERRSGCLAFRHPEQPCWETMRIEGRLQEACMSCGYRSAQMAAIPARSEI